MSDVEELRKRVRTLTSLLHTFGIQDPPSKARRDILPFLRYFTALLTCLDNQVGKPARVAVTGSINAAGRVQVLVVAQNPCLASASTPETHPLEMQRVVKKEARSLEDALQGPPAASLVEHIADVWTAFSRFDRAATGSEYERQLTSLECFVLSRSYRTFSRRFKADVAVCGGKRLHDVIHDWNANPSCLEIASKWVAPPNWLLQFGQVVSIPSRTVQGHVEWVFSDDTKKTWSEILEIILRKVDEAIEEVESSEEKCGKEGEEETRQAIDSLNVWSRALYYFINWKMGIVKRLLTKTNMVSGIKTDYMRQSEGRSQPIAIVDETDDEGIQFRQEPDESKGEQIFRYLKALVAWHAAPYHLCNDPTLPQLLENVDMIGVIEVCDALLEHYQNMRHNHEDILNILMARHSDTFNGCVHAEAALMGLMHYHAHESTCASHDAMLKNARDVEEILRPGADATRTAIAVNDKCCWCCDWLRQYLIPPFFTFPGTHGVIYPWDPPVVGMKTRALESLETALWDKLHQAVLSALEGSAPSSLDGISTKDMDRIGVVFAK